MAIAKKDKSMKEILDEQPKVPYTIPFNDNENIHVTAVTINGYRYEIKHGEKVMIPESIEEILNSSNDGLRKMNQDYRDMTIGPGRNITSMATDIVADGD